MTKTTTMDKPTTCRIGIKQYKISWETIEWSRSSGLCGQHDPCMYVIHVLEENVQPADQAHILLHEVMHALFDVIPEDCIVDDKVTEEAACEVVAHQLTEFFMNNPHVLNWYVESLRH